MTVKVIIKREVSEETIDFLQPLLLEMRSTARRQKGYVTGETWERIDDPGHTLVVSTWRSLEDWNNWFSSKERVDIQNKIDSLIGKDTDYEIYAIKK